MPALEGKVAAITGASSGIGEATALALAAEGAAVALAARREDRVADLASRIEGGGGRALAVATDVTDEEQANSFVAQANEELGGLDVLVNNAGVMLLGPVAGAPTDQWRQMIEVNLLGLLYCTHAALPIMGAAGSGDIVNVSSVAGRTASFGSGVYNMTKWGVVGFSEALRQECGRAGVRVTAIEPGWVDTELQGHNEHPAVVAGMKKAMEKVERVLDADDIARAITFAVTQPPHVSINEMLIRPTTQTR
ncbi:MAG TPA: SDR family NAD(P)-dependent oxidoreductase [Solirubrobacterales bacterium]|jgi:NADP-dependent 3-hydroxy acid dehydrogenase YdfG|nr:SDR family NAD(P)-dependent oxidoreductase [Solirubrobacterales bacterium]